MKLSLQGKNKKILREIFLSRVGKIRTLRDNYYILHIPYTLYGSETKLLSKFRFKIIRIAISDSHNLLKLVLYKGSR